MDNFDKFYKKSINFLSFRPRSEKEIKDYLKKKKADDLTSEKIIQSLKESKFINDTDFAKWFIEQRTIIKPKAERVIRIELKQKGIAKDLIEELFENTSNTDLEKARQLAERRIKRYSNLKDRKKVFERMGRYLGSKGFNYDVIKEVIDPLLSKEYNWNRQ